MKWETDDIKWHTWPSPRLEWTRHGQTGRFSCRRRQIRQGASQRSTSSLKGRRAVISSGNSPSLPISNERSAADAALRTATNDGDGRDGGKRANLPLPSASALEKGTPTRKPSRHPLDVPRFRFNLSPDGGLKTVAPGLSPPCIICVGFRDWVLRMSQVPAVLVP